MFCVKHRYIFAFKERCTQRLKKDFDFYRAAYCTSTRDEPRLSLDLFVAQATAYVVSTHSHRFVRARLCVQTSVIIRATTPFQLVE